MRQVKRVLLVMVSLPFVIPYAFVEILVALIFGRGFGEYRSYNILLAFYEAIGFESFVKSLANYESDTGRCTRYYSIATKNYLEKNQEKRTQGRYGNRF